jgi:hypothetical protein
MGLGMYGHLTLHSRIAALGAEAGEVGPSRCLASRRGVGREPDIGEQLFEPVHRLVRQAAEDVPKVGERVDLLPLATGREAEKGLSPDRRPGFSLEVTGNRMIAPSGQESDEVLSCGMATNELG